MKLTRIALLLAVFAGLTACATARDESWIGKDVGVTVDSRSVAPPPVLAQTSN